jgi:hypothetical protein
MSRTLRRDAESWVAARCAEVVAVRKARGREAALERLASVVPDAPDEAAAGDLAVVLAADHGLWATTA